MGKDEFKRRVTLYVKNTRKEHTNGGKITRTMFLEGNSETQYATGCEMYIFSQLIPVKQKLILEPMTSPKYGQPSSRHSKANAASAFTPRVVLLMARLEFQTLMTLKIT